MASRMRSAPMPSALAVYSGSSKLTATWLMAAQVVDLVGLHLLDDAGEVGAVGQVTVVQGEVALVDVRVLVEVVDAVGVEGRIGCGA
jgi:hypothetical protein